MNETIPVNFHCHSIFSDGEQTPEVLATNLTAAGVRYAALTDHDSLEGLARFHEAMKKSGGSCLPGVELTTQFDGREAHLLGYGFDPDFPDLIATLLSLRQVRDLDVHSIADSLRKIGSNHSGGSNDPPAISAAPNGQLEIGDAIDLLHRAGGRAFWAHPLSYEPDTLRLDLCVQELKAKGLDGLEAVYAPYSETQRAGLCKLAREHDLLICAGTDFHGANGPGSNTYNIEMPRADWICFRKALFSNPKSKFISTSDYKSPSNNEGEQRDSPGKPPHFRRRSYVMRIFLPTLIAISLFLAAIWGIILPSVEQTLIERKREMIRELTNSAWSILSSYEHDEQSGLISRQQAQAQAIARIQALRYGPEGKDYFWIQDMQPSMIMHPYRSDLNGEDLLSFTDPRGVPIFVEFAELVRREGEGYIDYVWQWKDDPQRLEPKESFVKGFAPWGWVIGTGIYTDDVQAEIARIEQNLINASLVISGAVILLLLFVLEESLRIERQRQEVLEDLRESTERYHSLIEATSEGTVLVVDGRCRYANPTFLNMTGYSTQQLEFLDLGDLLPRDLENQCVWDRFERVNDPQAGNGDGCEGILRKADGQFLECILALNPILFAGQRGFILLARDIARHTNARTDETMILAAQTVPIGIFRARAARRAVFLELNPAARSLIRYIDNPQPALADLFSDAAEFDSLLEMIQTEGVVKNRIVHLETSEATVRYLSLSARLVHDERKHTAYIDGTLEDVTTVCKQEAGREALIEKLQSSLLFLHEPIAQFGRDVVVCEMNTSIDQLSRLMTARNVTAALVSSENGAAIGIVTDHDLRARVLAENLSPNTPVHAIMSAPLTKLPESALIYQALLRMEEKGVRHLAVEDRYGQIVSLIDNKSLIQFQRYAPIVLAREISRSKTPDEITRASERIPQLVKSLLDSSARTRHVTNMLASTCDAATERLVQLAIEGLGPPPAAFTFIAMGSQGRQEQTLVTDQDNGIIFQPSPDANLSEVNEYFLRLGSCVCDGLRRAGYSLCRGEVMANNPLWCRSISGWLSGFTEWVRKSEQQEIIDLSIFFDFRAVYGESDLTHELRRTIHNTLINDSAFFHHFAQNTLRFKPPLRLLGSIYLGGGATEHAGEINLKDAMMPIVSFARLYALRYQINHTHTLDRIEALCERNIIQPSSRDEIIAAYDFLMQLRLQTQITAIQNGQPPQNVIQPGKLGHIQQELLKQAFAQIEAVQIKVSYDFLGGS